MSARRSPVERDARKIAGEALKEARRRRQDESAWQVLENAVQGRERATAYAVQRVDLPAARRQARAAQLLDEAQSRIAARQRRDRRRELVATGIVPGARVKVVRRCYDDTAAPVGTVLTLEDDLSLYFLHGTDDDGRRWSVGARDVELVPDEPACCDGTGWTGNPRTPCAEHYMHATDDEAPEQRSEWFECDRPGCGAVMGSAGGSDDEWDDDDLVAEHIAGHERDDAAVPA